MKVILTVLFAVMTLVIGAADADAFGGGGGTRSSRQASSSNDSTSSASVPEPSTLYAIGSGLALLGGATWYIRRRK